MSHTKTLRGPCQHCGSMIQYPALMVGTTTQCPHCGQTTELLLEQPAAEPAISRRVIGWTIAALLILLLGLAGAFIALNRAQSWAERHKAKSGEPAKP